MKRAPWKWYACIEGEADECGYESDSKEAAIAAIARDFEPGTVIEVLEARFSTAKKYEGHDYVPFIAVRNRETITLGLREVAA
ncbi:hypothetical protein [Novosphingobium sp.]|uniref:hypothetical protein n=1 Tax=Novosphingobium sp. TaxID=1874826 RepID=UPI002636E7E9|nr:hypothetical protein [Novosphingobium sp.]